MILKIAQYRDYQGAVRATVAGGRTCATNHYYPYGAPFATMDDFTPMPDRRLYGDKELLTFMGYNTYDYSARHYYAAASCFDTPDPLAGNFAWISPYTFCAGNPVRFIDEDGEKPTAYEASLMNIIVYGDQKTSDEKSILAQAEKALKKTNWEVSTFETAISKNHPAMDGTGIQSMLFERTTDGVTEYAYVIAGTNHPSDAVEDVTQLFGFSPQIDKAISNATTLSDELKGCELTFTGHSLGGLLATACSSATGREAICFNPAVMSVPSMLLYGFQDGEGVTNYISAMVILGISTISDPVTNIFNGLHLYAPGQTKLVDVGGISHGIVPLSDEIGNNKIIKIH